MTAIRAEKLSYGVGGKNLVEDISFTVAEGAFACIMGPNGAGKSTILKLIAAILPPSAGWVEIAGKPLKNYKRRELARILGYVPQNAPEALHFTVEEYVMTGRYPRLNAFGLISAEDRAVVTAVLERTGLLPLRGRDISTLSGGERQRVFIAAAMAQETPLLLLDEPTVHLDPKSALEVTGLLEEIHASGVTVLMVTHDINQALATGTAFIGIKNGRILAAGPDGGAMLEALFDTEFTRVESGSGPLQVLVRRGTE